MVYTPPVSNDVKLETLRAYQETGSINKAAAKLGIHRKAMSKRLKRWGISNIEQVDAAYKGILSNPKLPFEIPDGFVLRRNSAAFDKEGNLEKQWVETAPGGTEIYAVPSGHVVKGESALVDGNGRVLAKWVKTREDQANRYLIEDLTDAFESYKGLSPAVSPPITSNDEMLTLYPLPDIHFGMLSWGRETGADYDSDIAEDMIIKHVEILVSRSQPSTYAVLLGLGDYFHADDQRNATPGSGHQLDVDSRHARTFARGARLILKIIEIVASKHKYVEIRFLQGNHDITSSACLTVALALYYDNNKRIIVNDDPAIAWYKLFGKCLLGATHGHTVKMANMPGMMAVDCAEDWGKAKYRNFFSGHIHHEKAVELHGVRVESLQSPAARDAWNASGGYRSGRSLSAITFHKEEGEIARHRVNIV